MISLVFEAYVRLLWLEVYLVRANFSALYYRVRNFPVLSIKTAPLTAEAICHAVDLASILYPKQVLCLQRSAVTVCVLRHHGFRAQLVIGAQHMPFKSHAWVEVEGCVANDKAYIPEIYSVLDRC
jgi:Transglutaminase-like superfamily